MFIAIMQGSSSYSEAIEKLQKWLKPGKNAWTADVSLELISNDKDSYSQLHEKNNHTGREPRVSLSSYDLTCDKICARESSIL